MLSIKITDKEKFKQVDEVDLSDTSNCFYRGSFDGYVLITLNDSEPKEFWGQHSPTDWEDAFGFIVTEI